MAVPCGLPRILRDWYKNVPQDVYFDIFDVPKKIKLAKFGFLTNFVQLRLYNREYMYLNTPFQENVQAFQHKEIIDNVNPNLRH